jgi:protein tyrosine phosphatase (PTP) superfamily phosphohydrolase (DUF442 family)
VNRRRTIALFVGSAAALGLGIPAVKDDLLEKRVAVVEAGRLVRGAWQRPGPLRRVLAREGIRTIVTLTAINRDDPKYVAQARVVRESGVDWVLVPMRGSRATLAQMAEAADLLADPRRQPVFFHCVAGHHRTSLVHAAYRIRHEGWSAERAWREVSGFPWARPRDDQDDRRLIEAFAASPHAQAFSRSEAAHEHTPGSEVARPDGPDRRPQRRAAGGSAAGDPQLRRG